MASAAAACDGVKRQLARIDVVGDARRHPAIHADGGLDVRELPIHVGLGVERSTVAHRVQRGRLLLHRVGETIQSGAPSAFEGTKGWHGGTPRFSKE